MSVLVFNIVFNIVFNNLLKRIYDGTVVKMFGFTSIMAGQILKCTKNSKYWEDPFTYGIIIMALGSWIAFLFFTNSFSINEETKFKNITFSCMTIFILSKFLSQILILNKKLDNQINNIDEEQKCKDAGYESCKEKYKLVSWLKIIGFGLIMIAALFLGENALIKQNLIQIINDPFPIGVSTVFFINLLYELDIIDDYRFNAMNFFIVTKIIAQITHAAHGITAFGRKPEHKHTVDNNTITKGGGNVFRGFKVLS